MTIISYRKLKSTSRSFRNLEWVYLIDFRCLILHEMNCVVEKPAILHRLKSKHSQTFVAFLEKINRGKESVTLQTLVQVGQM